MRLTAIKRPKSTKDATLRDQKYRLPSLVFADQPAWKASRSNSRELDELDG
ncbi:hypothetical protein HFO94_14900 [Rhizobium leguminosarum]|uniref:hypothetical protein n=1 Tax=Rhizobium TaxID=379 RepID=UPI0014798040|nr:MULTISPECIES: hypothetical protein [Rhizobium]MBY5354803.1 hypothetical protein [Rhizobium leguminosarum]NNH43403.1 hypothetical protein [Rhizobium laguerreae]